MAQADPDADPAAITGNPTASLGAALPRSLAGSPVLDPLLAAVKAALDAVDPARAVRATLSFDQGRLVVGGRAYDLRQKRSVRVAGAGKAAGPMAEAIWSLLGEEITGGLVIEKAGGHRAFDTGPIAVRAAGHPVPTAAGVEATAEMLGLASAMGDRDLLLTLISGGASALLTLPAEGIALADLATTTDLLLRCGADIQELNAVRKHLSAVKGGRLSRAAHPASVVSLILSDVVGDRLEAIGSGPTAADPTTFQDALAVLMRHGLLATVPSPVRARLEAGARKEIEETLKPGDPILAATQNVIIGSLRIAAAAAVQVLTRRGFNTALLTTSQTGEAREAGKEAAALARALAENRGPVQRPACLVLGGETTVTVTGSGRGGRNQELALSAAQQIAGLEKVTIAAFATDGQDGPTDAAGAVATGQTVARARRLGLCPGRFLADNDAYPFFAALGDLIKTGPTGTNVADLLFVFAV